MEDIKSTLNSYFKELQEEVEKEPSMFNNIRNILAMCEIAKTLKIIDD